MAVGSRRATQRRATREPRRGEPRRGEPRRHPQPHPGHAQQHPPLCSRAGPGPPLGPGVARPWAEEPGAGSGGGCRGGTVPAHPQEQSGQGPSATRAGRCPGPVGLGVGEAETKNGSEHEAIGWTGTEGKGDLTTATGVPAPGQPAPRPGRPLSPLPVASPVRWHQAAPRPGRPAQSPPRGVSRELAPGGPQGSGVSRESRPLSPPHTPGDRGPSLGLRGGRRGRGELGNIEF